MTKVVGEDSIMDVIIKISEGNPGAMVCITQMLQYEDWYSNVPGALMVLQLDSLEVYGEKLYMLWNDCCNQDMKQLELVLRNWQTGYLTKEEIHRNLSQGRGVPFDNLKTLKEIFGEENI
jgi:hypothetical protein